MSNRELPAGLDGKLTGKVCCQFRGRRSYTLIAMITMAGEKDIDDRRATISDLRTANLPLSISRLYDKR